MLAWSGSFLRFSSQSQRKDENRQLFRTRTYCPAQNRKKTDSVILNNSMIMIYILMYLWEQVGFIEYNLTSLSP